MKRRSIFNNRLDNYLSKIRKQKTSSDNELKPDISPSTYTFSDCDSVSASTVDSQALECETDVEIMPNTTYPEVWTSQQWLERKDKHPWLMAKNGRLGCNVCLLVGDLGSHKSQGLSLSSEWKNCAVGFNGAEKTQQLKSLRTKISAHQASVAHKKAAFILAETQKSQFEYTALRQTEHCNSATDILFNTLYYLVKNDRPLSDHGDLLQLQKKNGLDVGISLHFRDRTSQIVEHIVAGFKEKLVAKLIAENRKISVIIDDQGSILIVYIKTMLDEKEEMIFLDLITLENHKADTIVTEVLKCFHLNGLPRSYLQRHVICFAFDGTSAILGRSSGVAKLLQCKLQQPDIIIWYCLSHRLELVVHDSIVDMDGVDHIKHFIDTIYALFAQSSKIQNELNKIAPILSSQLLKIGQVLDSRWVSSNSLTVSALWDRYAVLIKYFKAAAIDPQRSAGERKKFIGLFQTMKTIEFLQDLGLMQDILEELAHLSLQLQDWFCTLSRAEKTIKRTIRILETLKENPAQKENEIINASHSMKYEEISLINNKGLASIDRVKFINNIMHNLKARCFSMAAEEDDKSISNQLLADLEVLNVGTWPEERKKHLRYGEKNIKHMCARFRLHNFRSILNGFREYFDEGARNVPVALAPLANTVKTLPCSTSDCEQARATLNILITNLGTHLTVSNVSDRMFIKLNGPPLSKWDTMAYVNSWLEHTLSEEDVHSAHVSKEDEDSRELWKLF